MPAYILTGAPGSGKTAILRQLEVDGHAVVEEAATDVIALQHALGRPEPWREPGFIDQILTLQRQRERAAGGITFFDRSPLCTLALCRHLGLPPSRLLRDEVARVSAENVYERTVLFVRNQGFVEPTAARRISFEDSLAFERIHEATYRELGFTLVDVPAGPLPERVAAVRRSLKIWNVADEAPLSADEILDVVDEHDVVVGQAPRREVYANRLRHRAAFVLARDPHGRIFVHRRTARKLVFPSLYDMFVGGVVGAGETYDAAARREAAEELGYDGPLAPVPLFRFLYETPAHTWWSAVYEVRIDGPVRPQREEVDWHAFLTEDELHQRLAEWEWVPDGFEAYRRLREIRRLG